MATFLLIVIYIAFIGLGIPDSLFGTAWPVIYGEFQIPLSYGSLVPMIACGSTVASSMLSAWLIGRFGTNKVTAFSTALTAVVLLGYAMSGNYWVMCLLAVPLGIGAGAIDTGLNNYVSLHYSAVHMNLLHCFYGVGISISPYLMSLVIAGEGGWRGGYQMATLLQAGIALLLFATLGVWKKIHTQNRQEEVPQKVLSLKEILRIPGVKTMLLLFLTSCAIETTCSGWGSTYLVEFKHMAADRAAAMITYYYVGMALGRLLSGILATKLRCWQIIRLSMWTLGIALAVLLLPGPAILAGVGLFLVGLGNGPLFPNFSYLTPENFGEDVSQSVMGVQMATAYLGSMLAPVLCGVLGQSLGMGIFPVYMLVLFVCMIAGTFYFRKTMKAQGGPL